jgi:hypothetical protein
MENSDHEMQVNKARAVHNRIPVSLMNSPIVLSRPRGRIYHTLEFREQTEEEIQVQSGFDEWLAKHPDFISFDEIEMSEAASDFRDFQIPYIKRSEKEILFIQELWQSWIHLPNYKLLKAFVKMGEVPDDSFRDEGNDPLPLHQALLNGRQLGYNIPDSFLVPRKTNRAKGEAYYAARDLKRRQIRFSDEGRVVRKISSLSSGFLIPDPDEDWKVPFVIDQFWVVQERNARLRFIALEIDNEYSLSEENQAKAVIRDEKLSRQGIEVYHIAGWWCMVDAWRAICEFLQEANIYSMAGHYFHNPKLDSISSYICQRCNEPMIRWDDYWIQEISDEYGDKILVHDACGNEYY